MKVKDVLKGLLSGEDFSDHSTGKEDGHAPFHDKGCAFCQAWREALELLTPGSTDLPDFEPGDKVLICQKSPGRVVAVRTQVDVRLGESVTSGPIGTFAPGFVSHAPAEAAVSTYWRDRDGDIWERDETSIVGRMRMIAYEDGTPVAKLTPWDKTDATFARNPYDPLTRTEKP